MTTAEVKGGRRTLARWWVLYLALLLVSHAVWLARNPSEPWSSAGDVLRLATFDGGGARGGEVDLAYRNVEAASDALDDPPLVLLHGSPGSSSDLDGFVDTRALGRRLLIPDLPGFGRSDRPVPDYSVRAHARYVLALLDELGVERFHVLGFSMGGGVAASMADLAPERTLSLTLLSGIGVQELELFGDYHLNHLVHGAQLTALRVLPYVTPHFGLLDQGILDVPYARNFFDTDQRLLRGIFERLESPMLVIHGGSDFLVPVEAAVEHHRIVPQSELVVLPTGHFFVFADPDPAARSVADFLQRVDRGLATTRSRASPERVELASAPFDPAAVPPLAGPGLLVLLLLIAFATLVSEDLTCIGTGLLVAQGRIGFVAGTFACFTGILAGDLLLYAAGRTLGRPALGRAPLRWFVRPESVERAAAWFRARGGRVVFAARFVPMTRVATYVAAGMLGQPFFVFSLYFVLAGCLWTPLIVAFSSSAGIGANEAFGRFESWTLSAVALLVLSLFAVQRLVVPAFSFRGRRLLLGSLRRKLHWEFWPPWISYAPIVLWIAWQALLHKSLSVVTAVNPGIPTGGLIGESKSAILEALGRGNERVARFVCIPGTLLLRERRARVREFLEGHDLALPVVLKPDVGQRGSGVRILRDEESLDRALESVTADSLLQEYLHGREFGLFYVRRPSEEHGRIFSITEKVLPVVVGDGRASLEELILRDERAIALANVYFDANVARLADVPAAGEERRLVDLGTHCRGAIFLDGSRLETPELERAVDRLSRGFDGFFFGRYDVIAESGEALRRGEFRVLELNGLTAEAAHIYDPRIGLLEAYRVLAEQWRLAFEIGSENVARGARTSSLARVLREVRAYRRLVRRGA